MADDKIYLNVVVAGLNASCFEIKASLDMSTYELKGLISVALLHMSKRNMQLYKIKAAVSIDPVEDLLDRIPHLHQCTDIGVELEGHKVICDYFAQQPAEEHVHIIADVPHTDKTLYWLRLLCGRYWGRSDLRDSLYHQHSMDVPQYESADTEIPNGTTTVDYTLLKLGLDFKGFVCKGSEVLIMQEYIDLFQVAIEHTSNVERWARRGMAVTGRPGIGKGTFLLYVLIGRVLDGKPTILQYEASHFFLILGANPEQVAWSTSLGDVDMEETWALADTDAIGGLPDSAFINKPILMPVPFILFVSGPKLERWERWERKCLGRCYAMRSLSWNDFYILNRIVNGPVDVQSLRTIFVKFGGSLQVCRDLLLSREQEAAAARFEQQIGHSLDTRLCNILFSMTSKDKSNRREAEYRIFSLEPEHQYQRPDPEIVSRYIERTISATLSRKEEVNSQTVFSDIHNCADSRYHASLHASVCRIWEQLCITAFTRPIYNVTSFQVEAAVKNGISINISLPQKLVTYRHDKLADSLLEHSSVIFGPDPDLQQSVLMQPTGQTQPTYTLLEVSSSWIRFYPMTTSTREDYFVDHDSLNDIWDSIQAAADRENLDAGEKARFEALLQRSANGIVFQVIFVVTKERFNRWMFWDNLRQAHAEFDRQMELETPNGRRRQYAIECYGFAPIIGEV